jgi:hypothetical protein
MKNILLVLSMVSIGLISFACDKEDTVVTPVSEPALVASATSIILLTNASATVVIGNGTEPYTIVEQPNTAIANAQMTESRTMMISSKAIGSTTVKVKDSSSPVRTISVSIKVVEAYTTTASGSLSFNSNRGNIAVSGIGSLGTTAPTSGAGVIALSEFSGSVVYAYKVNSPTNIDVVTIYFQNNTSLSVGTYYYPASGRVVQISFLQNVNPNDTLSMDRGYILATSAVASIDTLSSSVITGTFEGTGYYMDHGTPTISQTISVTGGLFSAPILKIGKKQESDIEKLVLRIVKRMK